MSVPAATSMGRSGSLTTAKKSSNLLFDLNGDSNVVLFLRNLRLLDLDELVDWPNISTHSFSVKDAQQNQKKRIQSTEWALYRLFQLWDESTTKDKLQPFFPPLEPLQSLNLRAALFRCLSDLKKQGILGRDAVLRKSMLDECKGDRFEEVLATFSTAVLKRRLLNHGNLEVTESIAYRLATAEALQPQNQKLIPSLILSYRVILSRILQERDQLQAQCEDFKDLLDLKNRQMRRREEEMNMSLMDSKTKPDISASEIATISGIIQASWLGDSTWIKTIQDGEGSSVDKIFRTSFNQVWHHVSRRTLFEIEESSNKGLIDDLTRRVRKQRDRLEKWRAFQKRFDTHHKQKLPSTPHVQKLKQSANESCLRFDDHLNIGLGLQQPGPEDLVLAKSSGKAPISSSNLHKDYIRLMEQMSDELNETGKTKQRNSTIQSRRYRNQIRGSSEHEILEKQTRRRVAKSFQDQEEYSKQQSALSDLRDRAEGIAIEDLNAESVKDTGGLQRTTNKTAKEPENMSRQCLPPESCLNLFGPELDSIDTSLTGQSFDSISNGNNLEEHHPSLAERTRKSMATTQSNTDSRDGDSVLFPLENTFHLGSQDQFAPVDRRATLLERTRQSMSAVQLQQPQDKDVAEAPPKKSFPVNQFETPRKSIVPQEERESSTPKEDLFNQEADYASVFKSRPKIKTSPHISPELAKVELVPPENESGGDSDYDWEVESSPLGRPPVTFYPTVALLNFETLQFPLFTVDCASRPITILAISRSYKLFLGAALFFVSLTIILAPPTRVTSRLATIVNHLKPSKPAYWSHVPGSRPLSTSSMASHTFRKPPQAPPKFTATPQSLKESTEKLVKRSREVQDKIAKEVTTDIARFDSVILPIAEDENEMALESHIIGFYQAVSSDPALRDASTEAEKVMDDFYIESSMREDIFKLVDATLKKKESLDPESLRLLEKEYKSYIRNGLNLPAGPKRDRFKEIKKRMSDISITFQKNLNEETGGIWFEPEELDGVPGDVISGLEKGRGENEGKIRLTFKYPDLFPTLKFAKSAALRKQVLIANENKCNQNVPLFREIILLRDEAARLLGYPNHAAFRIEDKMAKTPKTVNDFLGDLRSRLTAGGKSEIAKLLSLKEEDLESRGARDELDGRYYLWDHRFYDRLMVVNEYSIDEQKIAEYFPLQTSIDGMLKVFSELFGLVFVEITPGKERDMVSDSGKGSDITWHPDVQIFSVWDDESEGSGFVGYLYMDLYPRDGKYGHAANFNIQPGFLHPDGTRRYPATALVCNFPKPSPKKPSLLSFDNFVTIFHETGHGIHDLVSRTRYSRFHGTSTVRDFVEAPSQMLENWCWTPSQLKSLSYHYSYLSPEYQAAYSEGSGSTTQPEKHIPDDLIKKLIATKHVNGALFNLRQLHFGIFDMTVHSPSSHEAAQSLDITALFNTLRTNISGIDGPEALGADAHWGHGQATFGHLIGGYDAGYYGYLSSQVYSADMFHTVFEKDPMSKSEGRRYRHQVLEKGGSQDEMETLKGFLGREPSTEPFYKELGLA